MTSSSQVNRILGAVLSLAVVVNGATIPAAADMSGMTAQGTSEVHDGMPHAASCGEGNNVPADDSCQRSGCDCSCFAPHFVMGVCAGASHPASSAADPPAFRHSLHLAGAFDAPFRPPA
ncbi:MAG TPA: hypothetical protein VML92_02560 [Steroidobacteraceae bacterium]|nr:hypothetical protein [Steroidobacteraceae bacterium]